MKYMEAVAINSVLVQCWMVKNRVVQGLAPSLAGVTLEQARKATEVVGEMNRMTMAHSGTASLICTVDPSVLTRLYAWAVLDRQDTMLAG